MATVLHGTLGVDDVNTSKQAKDVSKGLYRKYQNLNPILAILMYQGVGRPGKNPKYEWHTQDFLPRWDTITAVTTASGTTIEITPANIDYFKVGDLVQITGITPSATQTDLGVVTSKGTTLTISAVGYQNNGSSSQAAFPTVSTSNEIHIIRDASEEYSTMPDMKVRQVNNEWNYYSFLRAPYAIGNFEQGVEQYTGDERSERKKETHDDIRIQAEEDLVFGDRYYRDGTTGRQYFSRGYRKFITEGSSDNVLDWSGGLTESQWQSYLANGPCKAGVGSNKRFLFASTELFLKIMSFETDRKRILKNKTILGMDFTEYLAPGGVTLYVHQYHLFTDGWEGAGLIVDPTRSRIHNYRNGGVLQFHPEIQANDVAGIADEWRMIYTLELDRFEPHGWIHA